MERPPEVLLAQVIKKYAQRRVVGVTRPVVYGTLAAVIHVLAATHSGTVINTAFSERLNATFRACLAPLARRTCALAHQVPTLTAGMFLAGTTYNVCWPHHSLRLRACGAGCKWVERTPAMAAGLTDHCWTMHELLTYQIPLPRWVAPSGGADRPNRRLCGKLHDHGLLGSYPADKTHRNLTTADDPQLSPAGPRSRPTGPAPPFRGGGAGPFLS